MNQIQISSNMAYFQPIDDLIAQYQTDPDEGLKETEYKE